MTDTPSTLARIGRSYAVASYMASVNDHLHSDQPDYRAIGSGLVTLASDREMWAPTMAAMPPGPVAHTWIHDMPGARLVMLHREHAMSAVHSHHVLIVLAPITGCETHERYTVSRHPDMTSATHLATRDHLARGDQYTLIPPDDVHSHGHMTGTGAYPYTLILMGDSLTARVREEYDLDAGTWRHLAIGDPGTPNREGRF